MTREEYSKTTKRMTSERHRQHKRVDKFFATCLVCREDEDYCPTSKRVDGKKHSWKFDGDDPYVLCFYCNQRRDALSGKIITPFVPDNTREISLSSEEVMFLEHAIRAWRNQASKDTHEDWMKLSSSVMRKLK